MKSRGREGLALDRLAQRNAGGVARLVGAEDAVLLADVEDPAHAGFVREALRAGHAVSCQLNSKTDKASNRHDSPLLSDFGPGGDAAQQTHARGSGGDHRRLGGGTPGV